MYVALSLFDNLEYYIQNDIKELGNMYECKADTNKI